MSNRQTFPAPLAYRLSPIAILCLFALCALGFAQSPEPFRRSITVSGTGSVRVAPDLGFATLGVSKQSANLREAKSQADAAIAKIKTAVRRAGILEEEIRTAQYQIYRVQANPQAGIKEPYWKVVHMLQVRTKKPETIADVVDAAVAAGATDVESVGFAVDQLEPHRAKARELAVQVAMRKAQQLATLLNVKLGEVLTVSETGDFYPVQMSANVRFDAGGGMGGSGIAGGQIEVATTVQVVFGIR